MARIISFVMALAVCLSMAACVDDSGKGDTAGTTAGTAATEGTAAVTEGTAADGGDTDAFVIGNYRTVAVRISDHYIDPTELDVDVTFAFNDDGTGVITMPGHGKDDFTWESVGDGIVFTSGGESFEGGVEDGMLLVGMGGEDQIVLLREGESLPQGITLESFEVYLDLILSSMTDEAKNGSADN